MKLSVIKGISEKLEKELNKLGVYSTAELASYFPRAYLDLRQKQMLKYCYHNDVVLTAGKIVALPLNGFMTRRTGMIKAVCEQEGLIFSVIWFNQPYVAQKLRVG